MSSALEAKLLEAKQKGADLVGLLDEIIAATKPVGDITPMAPLPEGGLQNAAPFWDYIRGDEGELFPTLRQAQLDGIELLLDMGAGKLPLCWMAYVLATVYHETAKQMQPVREGLNVSDEWRKAHLSYYPYYGRGHVQLTHDFNYAYATIELKKLGFDVALVSQPDQALEPTISTTICIEGMLHGWFTGKKLRDYIPAVATREHYKNARRIVNGTDRADLIAGYAIEFEKGLRLGDWR